MKKILLIEDNDDIRENTAEILTLANYEVLTAENGKIGVELAQHNNPDLIVCDIMMPELDGFGVLHILSKKTETALIPFIFLTAKTEKSDIRKGMNLGADDYLTKPFDDTELLNAIESRLKKQEFRKREYESTAAGLDHFIKDAKHTLQLQDLCKDKKIRSVKKKSKIFTEGDVPSQIFFLQSGSIKGYKSHPDGKDLITNLYKPGDFFGFEPLLQHTEYHESAVALDDSEVVTIPKEDFLTLLNNHAGISASFISLLCNKVSDKEKQLLHLAYNSVRQRTAEAILKINDIKEGKEKITLSRDDLSKIVGTASESVIRVLSDFKDEGLIEIEGGKIKVINTAKLEKVVRWSVAK
ncbi:MAG TPA: response regulator [Cyclobacteriaceae bacterium]|jgi:DNA-binding response OmpR family regulator|nr:response regulator [Cyclobacteriaceae bacterium]